MKELLLAVEVFCYLVLFAVTLSVTVDLVKELIDEFRR